MTPLFVLPGHAPTRIFSDHFEYEVTRRWFVTQLLPAGMSKLVGLFTRPLIVIVRVAGTLFAKGVQAAHRLIVSTSTLSNWQEWFQSCPIEGNLSEVA